MTPSGSCWRSNGPTWSRMGLSRGTWRRSIWAACSARVISRLRSESGSMDGYTMKRGMESGVAKRAREKTAAS